MAYFPFFADLEGRKGLIVGGGRTALGKAEKLIPFGPLLTVAAPEFLPELESLPGITRIKAPFSPEMLEDADFAVAATNEPALNREISLLCRKRRVPVNVADDRELCTFLFPALVKRGPLTVGISTGGSSPTGAVWVKNRISALLPEDFGALLSWLETRRGAVKAALPPEDRAAFFAYLFARCLEAGRVLTEAEFCSALAERRKEAR